MATVFDAALCLQHWDWSETSQVAALFTREHGVVRVLAKGSKRPAGPYSGGLEALTLGEAGLILKPGRELELLTQWDLRDGLGHFRRSLELMHAGVYIVDLIRRMVIDRDPHPELFDTAVNALRGLATGPSAGAGVVLRFQWSIMCEAGYQPELLRDVRTEGPLSANGAIWFDARLGGLTNSGAAGGAETAGLWRLRPQTVQLLRALQETPGTSRAPRATIERASRLLAAYIAWVLGQWPGTTDALFPGLVGAAGGNPSRSGT